jgi:hypothetical protein
MGIKRSSEEQVRNLRSWSTRFLASPPKYGSASNKRGRIAPEKSATRKPSSHLRVGDELARVDLQVTHTTCLRGVTVPNAARLIPDSFIHDVR